MGRVDQIISSSIIELKSNQIIEADEIKVPAREVPSLSEEEAESFLDEVVKRII